MKKLLIVFIFLFPTIIYANDDINTIYVNLSTISDTSVTSSLNNLYLEEGRGVYSCYANDNEVTTVQLDRHVMCEFSISGLSYIYRYFFESERSELIYTKQKSQTQQIDFAVKYDADTDLPYITVSTKEIEYDFEAKKEADTYHFDISIPLENNTLKHYQVIISGDKIKINGAEYQLIEKDNIVKVYVEYFVDSREVEPLTVWNADETFSKSYYEAKSTPYTDGTVDMMLSNNTNISLTSKNGLYQLDVPLSRRLKSYQRSADGTYQPLSTTMQVIFQWYQRNQMNHIPSTQYFIDDLSAFSYKEIVPLDKVFHLEPIVDHTYSESTREIITLYDYRKALGFKVLDFVKLRKFLSYNYSYYPAINEWTTQNSKEGWVVTNQNTKYTTRKKTNPIYTFYKDNNWTESSNVSGYDQYQREDKYVSRKIISTNYQYYPSSNNYTNLTYKNGWQRYTYRNMYNCKRSYNEPYIGTCYSSKWKYQKAIRIDGYYGYRYAVCPSGWSSYYSSNFRTYRCKKYVTTSYPCEKTRPVTKYLYDRTSSCPSGFSQTKTWRQYRYRKVDSYNYAILTRYDNYYLNDGYEKYYETHRYKHRRIDGWNYLYMNQVGSPYLNDGYERYIETDLYRYKKISSTNYQYVNNWLNKNSPDFYNYQRMGYHIYEEKKETSNELDYDYILNQPLDPSQFEKEHDGYKMFAFQSKYSDWTDYSEYQKGNCKTETDIYKCNRSEVVEYPTEVRKVIHLRPATYDISYKSSAQEIEARARALENAVKEEKWALENNNELYANWILNRELVHSSHSLVAINASEAYLNSKNFKPYLYMDRHWRAELLDASTRQLSGNFSMFETQLFNESFTVNLLTSKGESHATYYSRFVSSSSGNIDESIEQLINQSSAGLSISLTKSEINELRDWIEENGRNCSIFEAHQSIFDNEQFSLGCD